MVTKGQILQEKLDSNGAILYLVFDSNKWHLPHDQLSITPLDRNNAHNETWVGPRQHNLGILKVFYLSVTIMAFPE